MSIPQISINCKMLSYQYGPTFLCFQHLVESMPRRIKAHIKFYIYKYISWKLQFTNSQKNTHWGRSCKQLNKHALRYFTFDQHVVRNPLLYAPLLLSCNTRSGFHLQASCLFRTQCWWAHSSTLALECSSEWNECGYHQQSYHIIVLQLQFFPSQWHKERKRARDGETENYSSHLSGGGC